MRLNPLWVMAMLVGIVVAPIQAKETGTGGNEGSAKFSKRQVAKPEKPARPKPEPGEVVISGNISRDEITKAAGGKATVKYVLTDTEGNKITLPKPKATTKKNGGEQGSLNLDDYLHVGVKVYGHGTLSRKNGKETVTLTKIHKIEKGPGITDIDIFSRD